MNNDLTTIEETITIAGTEGNTTLSEKNHKVFD